jgi:hypothetical protein
VSGAPSSQRAGTERARGGRQRTHGAIFNAKVHAKIHKHGDDELYAEGGAAVGVSQAAKQEHGGCQQQAGEAEKGCQKVETKGSSKRGRVKPAPQGQQRSARAAVATKGGAEIGRVIRGVAPVPKPARSENLQFKYESFIVDF